MPWRLARTTAISISRSAFMPPKRRSMSPSQRSSPSPRCAPKRRSKSSLASLPSSRSNSSCRPSSSLRKASRARSGSSPSARQKAAKDSKTFVVRTPPKSTSRPRRLGAKSHLLGPAGELDGAVAEALEEGVVGRAGHGALVIALHEHDGLPQRERPVPADVAHRAPAALLVAGDQLVAGEEALLARDRRELEHAQRRVVAVDPQRQQVADVGQRVADRAHLPVEDRDQPRRRAGGEHRVAQAEVAVHDRRRARLGQVLAQPRADGLDGGDLARLVVLPQAGEAPQLALEVARWLAEALQPARLPVDLVQLDERVDELGADAPAPG